MSITYEEWVELGEPLVENHRNAKWELGDWLLASEYNDEQAEVMRDLGQEYPNWIEKAAMYHRYKYDTFLEFRRVAKAFPKPTRVGALSWNHHRVVATVDGADERAKWLDKALKKGWSVNELRLKVADKNELDSAPSAYDLTKKEQQTLASLAKKTNLSERHVMRLMVRYFIMHADLVQFVDMNKTPAKRESYMTELRAKNGGKLKRWRTARVAA